MLHFLLVDFPSSCRLWTRMRGSIHTNCTFRVLTDSSFRQPSVAFRFPCADVLIRCKSTCPVIWGRYPGKLSVPPGQQWTFAQVNTLVPNCRPSARSCQNLHPSSADFLTLQKSKCVKGTEGDCSEVLRKLPPMWLLVLGSAGNVCLAVK